MKNSSRRLHAALAVVAAATTGGMLAATPASADSTGWPATNGSIAVNVDNGPTGILAPDDIPWGTPKTLPGSGQTPAWSPTGTRVVSIVGDHLVTQRYDGSGLHSLPTPLGGGKPNHPTYASYGQAVVYGDAGRLEVVPADGSYGPSYLMTDSQEPSTVCDSDPTVGLGDTVYFVRSDASCDTAHGAIWSYDSDSGVVQQVVADGHAPALSYDDSQLAYISGHGVYVSDPDGTGARQVNTDTMLAYESVNWSPDGTSLVTQDEALGDGGESPTVGAHRINLSNLSFDALGDNYWTPAWQPLRQVEVDRVYGSTSATNGIAASHFSWAPAGKSVPGLGNANSAVIVSNANSTFASLAPSLAAKKGGPVLTTAATGLDSGVQSELTRILPKGKTVYIVGGTSIVSSAVSTKLTSMGYKVTRLGVSSTRFVTSVSVAKTITSAPKYVFLATGQDYHSLMEAEAAAGSDGTAGASVALMTDNSTMTESVYDYLNTIDPTKTTIVTVGTSAQTALVNAYKDKHLAKWPSSFTYYPVTASTNVGTSVALARLWWSTPYVSTLVDGDSWKDGAAGFSAMAGYGPVMWASTSALDSPVTSYLNDESGTLQAAVVIGGTGSLSSATATSIGNATAVSGHWSLTNYLNGDPATQRSAATRAIGNTPAARHSAARPAAPTHNLGTPTRATR